MTLTLILSSTTPLPGGPTQIRLYDGSNPAVGVDWFEIVPVNNTWQLLGAAGQLVTSATVANRSVELYFNWGGRFIYLTVSPAVQTASQTIGYHWAPGLAAGSDAGNRTIPTPDPPLPPSTTVGVVTNNLQAGDQWSSISLHVFAYTK